MPGAVSAGAPRPAILWSAGFRPFFLVAALHALCAVPLWLVGLAGGPSPVDLALHQHEMLFGYAGAVIAGFLLTALPNWTGRPGLAGPPLAMLVAAWCTGRLALWPAPGAAWVGAVGDTLFLWGLVVHAWREILAAGNRRGISVCVLVTALATADLAFHVASASSWPLATASGAGLAAIALLIGLIGGRIVPSFTANWLAQQGRARPPAPFPLGEWQVLALTAAALATWLLGLDSRLAGVALAAATLLHAARLAGWRGATALREPLVLVLHAGYGWLVIGLGLLAAATLTDAVPRSAAVHAFGAGAIGTMTLAVMTRATLGHTGRTLRADAATSAIYVLITLGAILRVGAPWLPLGYASALHLAGGLWTAAFGLFAWHYGRYLLAPRIDDQSPKA
jgi:uncharacterized protein involved in response to NO